MTNNIKNILVLFLIVFLSSCASWRPQKDILKLKEAPPQYYGVQTDSTDRRLTWRELFKDSNLVRLIDTALARNYNRKIALNTIQAAQAELLRAQVPLLPQVQASLTTGADRYGDYTMNGIGNYDLNLSPNVPKNRRVPDPLVTDIFLGLRASWEIDIWHRLKTQKEAAVERLLASTEGVRWLNTNIVAAVASAYYELLALDAENNIINQNLNLQQRALDIVVAQKEAGRATELAVQQFQAQIYETRVLAIQLKQRVTTAENAIRVLLGQFDGEIPRTLPLQNQGLPEKISTGIPAQLLLNRPDIRQAEHELAASNADVYAARAALLPNLTINPYLGLQAFRPSVLLLPRSTAIGILGGLTIPIFNRKGLIAERDNRLARREAALNTYQQSIVTAYLEVQTELQQLDNLKQAYVLKSSEVSALTRSVEVSSDLYLAGYANYLEVITAQRSALKASLELAEMRQSQLVNVVSLYRALGGG